MAPGGIECNQWGFIIVFRQLKTVTQVEWMMEEQCHIWRELNLWLPAFSARYSGVCVSVCVHAHFSEHLSSYFFTDQAFCVLKPLCIRILPKVLNNGTMQNSQKLNPYPISSVCSLKNPFQILLWLEWMYLFFVLKLYLNNFSSRLKCMFEVHFKFNLNFFLYRRIWCIAT